MSKVFIFLISLIVILPLTFLLLPKTTLAANCDFGFYDPSDLNKPITPNVNMDKLTVKVTSDELKDTSYAAVLYTPMTITAPAPGTLGKKINIIIQANETANFTIDPETQKPTAFFTFAKVNWESWNNYKVYLVESQSSDPLGYLGMEAIIQQSQCTKEFPVIGVPKEACNTLIENSDPNDPKKPIYPNTPVILHVTNAKSDCSFRNITGGYDIYIEGNRQDKLGIYCPNTTGERMPLGKFDYREKPYKVELKGRCILDFDGNCTPETQCNPTQFQVLRQGATPPPNPNGQPATNSVCEVSPQPASPLNALFLTSKNLTRDTTFALTRENTASGDPPVQLATDQLFARYLTSDNQGIISVPLAESPSKISTPVGKYIAHLYDAKSGTEVCTNPYEVKDEKDVTQLISQCKQVYNGKVSIVDCTFSGNNSSCDTNDSRGPGIRTAVGCIHTSPPELVKDVMTFMLGISGGLAFLMMLLGAFQMLTSAGNPETLHAGRERLTSAIIGLLIVIFATLLLQIIGVDILKIPGFG